MFKSSFLGFRLTILISCSIALMAFDHRHTQFKQVRSALLTVVSPLQIAMDWPIQWVSWVRANVSSQQSLLEENADLRAESLYLRARLQRILTLQDENKNLRALLQSASPIGEYFSVAKLLAVSIEPYLAQLVLDKGNNHKVYVGQPVLDAKGVMGQVVHVGPLTSRVMLITDVHSAIPVQIARTGMRGIVIGNGPRNDLQLIDIPDTSDIQDGDLLLTSGLGLRYPAGYPVGTISKVANPVGNSFMMIKVRPTAGLNKSRQVLLVWRKSKATFREAENSLREITQQSRHS